MKFKVSLALIAAAGLTACVSSPPPQQMAVVQPQGVEGTWADPNGILSTFSAGRFETRTADGTNTLMASGTYTTQPDGMTQLNMFSNISKTTSLVNCRLASPTQLNCTSQTGTQFSLMRRS